MLCNRHKRHVENGSTRFRKVTLKEVKGQRSVSISLKMALTKSLEELEMKYGKVRESEKFLCEFIAVYQAFPCLWKYNCKDYRNRFVKERAYATLVDKMREVDPRADKNSVIRKINALRTAFRREYKKIRKSKISLSTGQTKKKYVTSLWYYDLLKFVVEQQDFSEPLSGSTTANRPDELVCETPYISIDGNGKMLYHNMQTMMDFLEDTPSIQQTVVKLESSSPVSSRAASPTAPAAINVPAPTLNLEIDTVYSEKISNSTPSGRREDAVNAQEPTLGASLWHSRKHSLSQQDPDGSDLDRFGAYVALKLKRSTKKQSIIAEKVIAEVLMRANLGTLEESTILTDIKMEQQIP